MKKKKSKQVKGSKGSKGSNAKAKALVELSEPSEPLNPITLAEPAPAKPPSDAAIKKAEMKKVLSFLDGLLLEFFHDPEGVAYVSYRNPDTTDWRTCAVDSPEFKRFLRHQTWKKTGLPLPKSILADRIVRYSTQAEVDGPERPVFLRVGEHDGAIFVDLHNDAGQAVKVTAEGWDIVDNPDCKFRRALGMQPLPKPVHDGSIHELDRFLMNLSSDDRILFLGALLGAFQFKYPKPIVYITGESRSGKSSLAYLFRSLIDPEPPEEGKEQKVQKAANAHNLFITASNSWILNLGNMSALPHDMSDTLSMLATGASFRTRKLGTDTGEQIFRARRMILFNSIEDLATREDFLYRTIHLHSMSLVGRRRNEKSLAIMFKEKAPLIFGALLDAVSCALKNLATTKVNLPDMVDSSLSDFTQWVCAGASALGFTPEEFLNAYAENRTVGSRAALEASPIYLPLLDLLEVKTTFYGSTQDLLDQLRPRAGRDDFPRTPHKLGRMLARIIPNLRTEGIEVKDMGAHQTLRTTVLEITRTYSESELKARAIAAEEKAEAEKAQQAKDLKDFEENRARVAKVYEEDRLRHEAERAKRKAETHDRAVKWLRQTLSESPTPLRNKVVYATPRGVDRISQSDIDAAAVALNVVEELRPEGKFWSLPKSETQSNGSEGSEGSVEKHNA